ncbi:hypothetical protein SAMD00019534_106150 [Acytostelium subglobosum LB1]|uniref:hypothetical protein n=1 Tax=Acytostelium subglobosum LB1 TaxID=1410327 RepID=UPI000644E536|nr:hypothetical protein SAMD00019534_106150 [Acytostelium subglobosum LB1]GAM27439.1 hypothetical protein SAMD00019534_106150 [Acytostelium subglobosum LB1]|eukprot:XP_012749504.1 hypothetical protein SAMD00019534_106150 [Acytostelium subglobosum LB1]
MSSSSTSTAADVDASSSSLSASAIAIFKEQKMVSKQIEKQLKQDKKRLDQELKLLLLGTGDSGKSTIVKQMRILHLDGYTQEDRINHKSLIYRNVVEVLCALIEGCQVLGHTIQPTYSDLCDKILDIMEERKYQKLERSLLLEMVALSKDEAIRKALVSSGSNFQVHSSAEYFLNSIERISEAEYIPTDQDILWTRVSTTAVTETSFSSKGMHFRMIDVGGQRGHRDKWIHHFSDVTSIFFVVSLSEYDQVLEEDTTTNRMLESMKVFTNVINGKWFKDVPVLLFLNKRDLFMEKIKRVNLNVCFEEYDGSNNYEEALAYIKRRFLACNKIKGKLVYTHVTTATDTNNIRAVFDAVKDILTRQTMEEL